MFSFLNEAASLRKPRGMLTSHSGFLTSGHDGRKTRQGGGKVLQRLPKRLFPQTRLGAKSGQGWL